MSDDADDSMVKSLERIANDLERVILGIYAMVGLLAVIAFILVLRTMIGR